MLYPLTIECIHTSFT